MYLYCTHYNKLINHIRISKNSALTIDAHMCKSINTFAHTYFSHKKIFVKCLWNFCIWLKARRDTAHVFLDKQTAKRIIWIILKTVELSRLRQKMLRTIQYDCETLTLNYNWNKMNCVDLNALSNLYIFISEP